MSTRYVMLVALAAGCETEGVFVPPDWGLERMLHQPRYDAYEPSEFFDDARVLQHPPEGTVPVDTIVEPALRFGVADGRYLRDIPLRVDAALLARGRNRFEIFCAPCHGVLGDGASVVAANMPLVRPPSLHMPRIRDYPPGRIFRVITDGYGLMPAYRMQLDVDDRWAVVAYVQALQLSQNAALMQLPEHVREAARQALP